MNQISGLTTCCMYRTELSLHGSAFLIPHSLGVHQNIFHYFDQAWGPFTSYIFASSSNFKVKKFYSQFWTPGSSSVDAFAFDWAQDMDQLVPPFNLISKAIKHIIHCQAKDVLVVPKWKSSVFWPAIVDISGNFRWFIIQHVEYEKPLHFFCAGSDKNSIFAANKFNSNILVLNIDATYMQRVLEDCTHYRN